MQSVSCHTWLASSILMKADKMSMAHSLEVRVPFLDHNVFDVAAILPLRLRVDGDTTKVALRRAAAGILPDSVAMRPKLGFPVPFRSWLKGDVAGEVRELFADSDDPVMDRRALLDLLDGGTGPTHERRVWTVLTYLLWRRDRQANTTDPVSEAGVISSGCGFVECWWAPVALDTFGDSRRWKRTAHRRRGSAGSHDGGSAHPGVPSEQACQSLVRPARAVVGRRAISPGAGWRFHRWLSW